jgi:hypothetical protein
LDALLRGHLDREAAGVDAGAMLQRVRTRPGVSRRRWFRAATVGLGGGIAAGLGIAFYLGGDVAPAKLATAEELVREAKAGHEASPADRVYEIDVNWELSPFQRRFPFRPIARKAKVWTRGDQFVVQARFEDGGEWRWGQEQSGRVWIAPSRRRVLIFEPDERTEPLARFCELMSLRLVSTLGETLEKYEMHRLDRGQPGEPIRIDAKFRPQPNFPFPRFRRIELELDPATKLVRRAVLHSELMGEPIGEMRFTLLETTTLPDEKYEYRGHVDANAERMQAPLPPKGPMPAVPPVDPRTKFREEWLKRWQK